MRGIIAGQSKQDKGDVDQLLDQISHLENELKTLRADNSNIVKLLQSNILATQMLVYSALCQEGESSEKAKQRIMRNMPKGDLPVRIFQLAGLILLNVVDNLCREYSIPYWLDFGALVGAVRHGSCIPWDDDIDICMLRKDIDKLRELLDGNQDFFLDELYSHTPTGSMNHIYQLKFKKTDVVPAIGCCLDIFVYDYVKKKTNCYEKVLLMQEMRREHRKQAWNLYNKLKRTTSNSEWSDSIRRPLKSLFEEYLQKTYDQLDLDLNNGEALMWAIDNTDPGGRVGFMQSCSLYSQVFPLVEVSLEGKNYLAPNCINDRLAHKFGDWYSLPFDIVQHRHFSSSKEKMHALAIAIDKFADPYLLQIEPEEINLIRTLLI